MSSLLWVTVTVILVVLLPASTLCVPGDSFLSSNSCHPWSWAWKDVVTNSPSLLFSRVCYRGADCVGWWKHERLWQLVLLVGAGHRMWDSATEKMISEGFSAPQSEWVNSRWTFSNFWRLQHIEQTSDFAVAQADKEDKYLFLCAVPTNQRLQLGKPLVVETQIGWWKNSVLSVHQTKRRVPVTSPHLIKVNINKMYHPCIQLNSRFSFWIECSL